MKLAIVDDHAAVSFSFSEIFQLHGYQSVTFGSSEEFLDFVGRKTAEIHPPSATTEKNQKECSANQFDCLLVDLNLPGISGLELITHLRARSIMTPAILISGNIEPELMQKSQDLEHVIALVKPCSPSTVLQSVKNLIDNAIS